MKSPDWEEIVRKEASKDKSHAEVVAFFDMLAQRGFLEIYENDDVKPTGKFIELYLKAHKLAKERHSVRELEEDYTGYVGLIMAELIFDPRKNPADYGRAASMFSGIIRTAEEEAEKLKVRR